jgi:hypothetical protein
MRLLGRVLCGLLVGLAAVGCGNEPRFNAKGRIVKGGAPYHLEPGQGLRISFTPVQVEGGKFDQYAAVYDSGSGTFQVVGKDGKGLPPGQYHVSLQLMKNKEDLWNGALLGAKSPFTIEVSRGSGDIVLDLDLAKGLTKGSG